jgi:hypothetical protein
MAFTDNISRFWEWFLVFAVAYLPSFRKPCVSVVFTEVFKNGVRICVAYWCEFIA